MKNGWDLGIMELYLNKAKHLLKYESWGKKNNKKMTEWWWVVVSILISNLNPGNLSLIDRAEEEKENYITIPWDKANLWARDKQNQENKLGKRQKK